MKIEDVHIGLEYEEYQLDSSRHLNKGHIWVRKTYSLTSPRLYKMKELIEMGKIRKYDPTIKPKEIGAGFYLGLALGIVVFLTLKIILFENA